MTEATTQTNYAEIFFGSLWRIDEDHRAEAEQILRDALTTDEDFDDMLDTLAEKYNAKVSYDGEERTIVFGRQITTISHSDNSFDEMSLLRVMDLDKGVLLEEVRNEVKQQLEEVPYNLREHLSSPGFCTVWAS
jgi:hypothetical protein